MQRHSIDGLVSRRQFSELEMHADELVQRHDWNDFLCQLSALGHGGKTRDALVHLLNLENVGGTDADLFKEFASLKGDSLQQVRTNAIEHAMVILKEQIENRHTFFLDVEAMATTPFAILVKDIIDARRRELEELQSTPSRIDVLRTYYGFTILMLEGSQTIGASTQTGYYGWRRRSWGDPQLTDTTVDAMRKLTGEFANAVDVDKAYRTLGSSRIFRNRCTRTTADILANAVRLTLYKAPGNRSTAARALGRTEDSRCLPFLHHRLPLEGNRRAKTEIVGALEKIGHPSSIDVLRSFIAERYLSRVGEAAIRAMGKIHSPRSKEILLGLLETGRSATRAMAIEALSGQNPEGIVRLLTPYLVDKSRPVSRASVLTLAKTGSEGRDAIRANASVIVKRIGYDKPSRAALTTMLCISDVGQMREVQQYVAKRIEKCARDLRRWSQQGTNRYHSYYWRRREVRSRERLIDYVKLAAFHLKPPFDGNLTKAVMSALILDDEQGGIKRALGENQLAKALTTTQSKDTRHVQTFLSLFR